ncbi:MAG: prolipoprotein diacylglyceryl transferase [Clostridia bacterium]
MMEFCLSAIDKIAFRIGSVEVAWYGIILVSAMILGLVYIMIECKRIGLTSDDAVELFLWIIPLAIVFARVFYVVVRPEEYFPWNNVDDFVHAIAIWDGGITIIGGIVGGFLGICAFTYRKRKKTNIGSVIDLIIPPLLTGQIIGRLGNFVNQEAFGVHISNPLFQKFPFAVYIDNPSGIEADKMNLYKGEGWYAATCFYEMAWNLVGLAIAYGIWRKNKKYPGILAAFYLVWYLFGRGMLEFIRLDAVPVTQVMCFTLIPIALVFGLIYIIYRNGYLSFKKINDAVGGNLLYITEVSDNDIKNYNRVANILKGQNKFLMYLFGVKKFEVANIENMHYIDMPKKVKTKKKCCKAKNQSNE